MPMSMATEQDLSICLPDIQIPPAWERLTLEGLSGPLMVIGATDTGKSTFARYLYCRLCRFHERVAFVDGDVGQSSLGPPTTMTLVVRQPGEETFPPSGPRYRVFIGDCSPRGHLLSTVIGLYKLVRRAQDLGTTAIVVDTTGLVDRAQAGGVLKQAKVELIRPAVVYALQRGTELEYMLLPLRRSRRTRVVDLPISPAVRPRDVATRRAHRAEMFRRYFEGAGLLEVPWGRMAVFPAPTFRPGRLVALEDVEGFALALGVVVEIDPRARTVRLRTPLPTLDGVDAIRLGSLSLDPDTGQEVAR